MARSTMTLLVAIGAALAVPASGQQPAANTHQAKQAVTNPNDKICEDVAPAGSRIATKRFCGTRAEWVEKKRQAREDTELMQRPMQCSVMGGHHC